MQTELHYRTLARLDISTVSVEHCRHSVEAMLDLADNNKYVQYF